MISIILPVYNQYYSLVKVLNAFCIQTFSLDKCEFIIVDDGSTDELSKISFTKYMNILNCKVIHKRNQGRAAARNTGIEEAKGDIVIFCDADRFPKFDFISKHLEFHQKGADIVVGASYDYFGKENLGINNNIDWVMVNKFSRLPPYFRKISLLYDENGQTSSELSWLSFLVGNSSIKKSLIKEIGGFDESFVEWGFEHFDLAYRLYCEGYKFYLNRDAVNYHIPHLRQENFYKQAITLNSRKFSDKYPLINEGILAGFVNGSIDIEIAENKIYVRR